MSEGPIVFYDGDCGLCHHTVTFLVARDREGRFRYAPLGGPTVAELVPEQERLLLPDSVVLFDPDRGELLVRSEAVRRCLQLLGGVWGLLGALMTCIPRVLRDGVYDFIARIRHRVFAPPPDACPLVPVELRGRFLP